MSSMSERRIRDVRDLWSVNNNNNNRDLMMMDNNKEINSQQQLNLMHRGTINNNNASVLETNNISENTNRTKHKYKTLERHLSMKKTIRKKMMRDLREIGDAASQENQQQHTAFLEQIKNDQPPPENIEKPSLWKRLTKGWAH